MERIEFLCIEPFAGFLSYIRFFGKVFFERATVIVNVKYFYLLEYRVRIDAVFLIYCLIQSLFIMIIAL